MAALSERHHSVKLLLLKMIYMQYSIANYAMR